MKATINRLLEIPMMSAPVWSSAKTSELLRERETVSAHQRIVKLRRNLKAYERW
jgi:hypothetical protein